MLMYLSKDFVAVFKVVGDKILDEYQMNEDNKYKDANCNNNDVCLAGIKHCSRICGPCLH